MTLRVDEQGRPQALVAYSPDQARDPAGSSTGGQFSADQSDQSAAGDDAEAKALYSQLLAMPPEQRDKFLAGLNNDQLTRLGKFASLGKATSGPIADIRNKTGSALKGRGINPAAAGLKEKAGAKKKAPAKKGGSGKSGGGSKGGGGKSSGGSSKKSSGGSKSSGSKSNGSKSSGSKSSGSKSSSPKAPAKPTKPPKPAPTPPPPPAVTQLPSTRPGGPIAGPPTTQTSRPARRLGKRRRSTGGR